MTRAGLQGRLAAVLFTSAVLAASPTRAAGIASDPLQARGTPGAGARAAVESAVAIRPARAEAEPVEAGVEGGRASGLAAVAPALEANGEPAGGEDARRTPARPADDEAPALVRSVEIHLSEGADPSGLAELVSIHTGAALSRFELRRSIERLWGTGRFSDVAIWEQPAGFGQVDIVVEATARTFVERVEFEGNRVLTAEALLRAGGLTEQPLEYYPELVERLSAKLREAYRRVGHVQAAVDAALSEDADGGTTLTFRVAEGAPVRINALSMSGEPRWTLGQVVETLGLAPGDVLDFDRLDRGVRALREKFRAEGHWRVRLGEPQVEIDPEGASVRLPISAGPKLRFGFYGNRLLSDGELRQAMAYDPEDLLDEEVQAQLAERLVARYRLLGFADARVRVRERRERGGRAEIVFAIQEGLPLRVVSIAFVGNEAFATERLRDELFAALTIVAPEREEEPPEEAGLVTGIRGPAQGPIIEVDPTTVYSEVAYQKAIAHLLDLYRAEGYLSALIEMPIVERDERRHEARLTLRVREGVQTRVAEVTFPGAERPEELAAAVSLRPGQPLGTLEVENARREVERALGSRGYLFARVDDELELSPDRRSARVHFAVAAGPRVRVGHIIVQGLVRTREDVVRSALAVEQGGVLDPEALAESQRNLARIGIFRTAGVRINDPEVPDAVKDVYVTVDERSTQNMTLGAGFSLFDGPRAYAEYTKINLLGRALQFQARAKVNDLSLSYLALSKDDAGDPLVEVPAGLEGIGRRFNLGLRYPRFLSLLPTEVGARLDLLHERVLRPAYIYERSAAIIGSDLVTRGGYSASLQYGLETDEIQPPFKRKPSEGFETRLDQERLRFQRGTIHLHSFGPTLAWDGRDNPSNPRRGAQLLGAAELVQSLGGEVVDPLDDSRKRPFSLFVKASAQANAFFPLGRSAVLALSLKGGRVLRLDPDSNTLVPKRFFVGGPGTMRGFYDDGMMPEDRREALREQIKQCERTVARFGCTDSAQKVQSGKPLLSEGGELFTLARSELRFPLLRQLEAALFFDAGNLWLDPREFLPLRLRYAAGAGVRIATPIGPAALDLGINLDPDLSLNESRFVPHFSIGLF